MALHKLKIDEGLCLDEFHLHGVSAYKVEQNEGDDIACLTLKMDVSILGNEIHPKLNSLLNEERDRVKRD